jgi:hypothetical protein
MEVYGGECMKWWGRGNDIKVIRWRVEICQRPSAEKRKKGKDVERCCFDEKWK